MAPVIVLGGGASGVLLALHLIRDPAAEVVIVERRPELGAGIAYATGHPEHLLNVRAANMSAFPDDPGHFVRWLAGRDGLDAPNGPDAFAPRRLYRDYLGHLVAPLLRSGRLRHVHGEAVALRAVAGGAIVTLGGGATLHGAAAVVATGNEGPAFPPAPWRHQGWGDPGDCRLAPDAAVAVVGTGLTMVDRVLWLLHGRHRGPITAVSRHGLMPQAHQPGAAPPSMAVSEVPLGASVAVLTRWLRERAAASEAKGDGWRDVVDGIRPHSQALWASLSGDERRRFLRHVQPFWGVHRHRVAPAAAERIAAARASGQLRVVAGRIGEFVPCRAGVTVVVHRRGGGVARIEVAALFECRGRRADITQTDNPLLRDLLTHGAARPDALGIGLDVTRDCAVVDASGLPSRRLYAIGPVTAGTFWESTAVPDIRLQARAIAETLLAPAWRASYDAARDAKVG